VDRWTGGPVDRETALASVRCARAVRAAMRGMT